MFRPLLLALAVFVPVAGLAQNSSTVTFQPGNYGTMVSGAITGHDYMDYHLDAQAGQEMFVELTAPDGGTVYFNILPPGSKDVAIYNSSIDGNTAKTKLSESGTYTIRVYQMGNAKDGGRKSSFNIDLSIQ